MAVSKKVKDSSSLVHIAKVSSWDTRRKYKLSW